MLLKLNFLDFILIPKFIAFSLIDRIKHTYILDDPFDDPPQIADLIPDASPEGKPKDEVMTRLQILINHNWRRDEAN